MKPYLKVKQTRSVIGQTEQMGLTLKGLGLGRPGMSVVVKNTPSFRGAVKKVMHLVSVEETDAAPPKKPAKSPAKTAGAKEARA